MENGDRTDEFARLLMQWVRDEAIRVCDMNLSPGAQSLVALAWRQLGAPPADLAAIVPDVVDATLACLFRAVDQGVIRIKYIGSDEGEVEVSREFDEPMVMICDDWRARYSKERYVDYIAGVKFDFSSTKS